MGSTMYTATGCSRCKIAKKFMDEHAIPFQELDIKAEGKDPFGQFYRNNRSAVFRGKEGIEFPIFTDDVTIRQGVGVVLAYLHAGTKLDGFIGRSELSHGWMDGIHVSEGDPSLADDLITVLSYIKRNGLNLQLDTDGRNASVLEKLLEHKLGDRLVMDVKGPLTPVVRQEEGTQTIRYLTTGEIEETAKLIQEVTGTNKQPYLLRLFDPSTASDQRLKSVEKIPPNALFSYRLAARRHQVLTEIEKS
jgi:glutaredoxin